MKDSCCRMVECHGDLKKLFPSINIEWELCLKCDFCCWLGTKALTLCGACDVACTQKNPFNLDIVWIWAKLVSDNWSPNTLSLDNSTLNQFKLLRRRLSRDQFWELNFLVVLKATVSWSELNSTLEFTAGITKWGHLKKDVLWSKFLVSVPSWKVISNLIVYIFWTL